MGRRKLKKTQLLPWYSASHFVHGAAYNRRYTLRHIHWGDHILPPILPLTTEIHTPAWWARHRLYHDPRWRSLQRTTESDVWFTDLGNCVE